MELSTEISGLALRTAHLADASELTRLADDEAVSLRLRDRFPHPYRLADAESFLTHASQSADLFALVLEGRFVGMVGDERGTDIARCSAEVGYWLGRLYWGRGLATAAVRALVQRAFEHAELVRLSGIR